MRSEQDYLRRRSEDKELRGEQAICRSAKLAHRLLAAAYTRRAAALEHGSSPEETL